MARSRSPNLRMRSPRLRLRLAVPRYSVARDAQRGSLTLARTLDSLASPPVELAKRSTPRVAGSVVPHLARNLPPYREPNSPTANPDVVLTPPRAPSSACASEEGPDDHEGGDRQDHRAHRTGDEHRQVVLVGHHGREEEMLGHRTQVDARHQGRDRQDQRGGGADAGAAAGGRAAR